MLKSLLCARSFVRNEHEYSALNYRCLREQFDLVLKYLSLTLFGHIRAQILPHSDGFHVHFEEFLR